MTGRSRCAGPLSLLGAIVFLAAPLPSARADIVLQVNPGIDRFARSSAWTPIVVRLTGTYRRAEGRLEVVTRLREGMRTVATPVRLTGAAVDELHTLVYDYPDDPAADTVVRLVVDGRMIAQKKVEGVLPISDDQPAIVVLTQDQSGLYAISGRDLGYGHRGVPRNQNTYSYNYSTSVPTGGPHAPRLIYPRPSALPDTPRGYAVADVIALGDVPLDTLTDRQWDAIRHWVEEGGTLVVSGGADLPRLKRKELAEILPIDPAQVRTVPGLGALDAAYQASGPGGITPLTDGPLRDDAVVLAGSSGAPLVVARRFGQGVVFFTTFDLFSRDMRAWRGQAAFWKQILSYAAGDVRVREALSAYQGGPYGSQYYYNGGYGNRSLIDTLAGRQSTEAPGFAFIGLFLLLYVVLLVPVNYLLLKRWDKKELAWITAPIIIGVFTVGAYGMGYSMKGATLFLRHAGVVEGAANSNRYAAYTVATLFSPAQRGYDIGVADPDSVVREITDQLGGVRSGTDLGFVRGERTVVEGAAVSMWDHRSFAFDGRADLGGAVEATSRRTATGAKIDIVNKTQHALRDCWVLAGGARVQVGDLAVGASESVTVPIVPSSWGQQSLQGLGGNAYGGSGPSIRVSLADALMQGGANVVGNPPLMLVGWTNDNVTGLGIDGMKPVVDGASLIVVHLPPGPGRLSAYPPAGPQYGQNQSRAYTGYSGYGGPGGPMGVGGSPPRASGGNYSTAMALNSQAYNEVQSGNLDQALKTAQRAYKLAPNQSMIADTLGEMYQRKGNYKSAAVYYRKALKLPGGYATIETHEKFGETLYKLGKKQEALAELQIAASNPNQSDTWVARARTAIERINQGGSP